MDIFTDLVIRMFRNTGNLYVKEKYRFGFKKKNHIYVGGSSIDAMLHLSPQSLRVRTE